MKLIIIIIIEIYLFNKYLYPSRHLKIKDLTPVYWELENKNIDDIVSLTFLFKVNNFQNVNDSCLVSFQYYNNNVDVLKLKKHSNTNYYLNLKKNESNTDQIINKNKYYFVYYEWKKVDIKPENYKINFKLIQGDNDNSYSQQYVSSNIYDIDLDRNYFIFGNCNLFSVIKLNLVQFENITMYNRSLNSEEINGIKFGNSEALIFLNFSDSLVYSQYFHNKINNGFLGGINGDNVFNDPNDVFSEYYKNTNISKKYYLINNKQFIKLTQEAILIFENFWNKNYLIYLKVSLHLNSSSIVNPINNIYNIYNRENKSGIKFTLNQINGSASNKFEFVIGLIESGLTSTIISDNDKLNFEYWILTYNSNTNTGNYDINLKYNYNEINDDIINDSTVLASVFLKTDNHYIGNSSIGTTYTINYILIELEEFMFGKGSFFEEIDDDIYYDNIALFCNDLNDNKIKRNNLEDCDTQRNETIPIESDNCELKDSSNNCIFKYPDVNETVNSINISISKPYRQVFNNNPNIDFNSNDNKSSSTSAIKSYDANFNGSYTISNNLVIEIEIIIVTSLYGNIFEIEFNSNKYSKFVLNKNNSKITYAVEINNTVSLTNPSIKIINISDNNFDIKSIKLIEINYNNIVSRTKKFIGEKISNYFEILNKEYSLDSSNKNDYRIIDDFLIKCSEGCEECNGPLVTNCQTCKDNYLKFRSTECIKIIPKNCNGYYNSFYCSDCNNSTQSIIINKIKAYNNYSFFCFNCHPNCQPPDPICDSCSNTCLSCDIVDYNPSCKDCPYHCFSCNFKKRTCHGFLQSDCFKCKNSGNNRHLLTGYPFKCGICTIKNNIIKKDTRKEECKSCHSSCKKCYNVNYNNCIECNDGKILNEDKVCIDKDTNLICPPNYVLSPKNLNNPYEHFDKCFRCNNCNTCLLSDKSLCTSCNNGKYLLNGKCIYCALDGQFLSNDLDIVSNRICKNCYKNCKNCISENDFGCISCISGKYLKSYNSYSYYCTNCNEDGYFKKGLQCIKCDNNCFNCSLSPSICKSCKNNYVLDNLTKTCLIRCRDGTYSNGTICINCSSFCETCYDFGNNKCFKCKSGLYLDNITNECKYCKNINEVIIKNRCYRCHNYCRQCFGIYHYNCLNCEKNKFWNEISFECVENCPNKTYIIRINNLKFCRKCNYGCLKCKNNYKNSCLLCEKNFIFNKYTNNCTEKCEDGYYLTSNKTCDKCIINCSICNDKNCIKCEKGYYFTNNNTCIICEKGFFIFKNKCIKCHKYCETCISYDKCIVPKFNPLSFKCKKLEYFNYSINKCDKCKSCLNCQYKNHILCENCLKCKNNCYINFKFNETGLYLFNNKYFKLDKSIWYNNNKNILNLNYSKNDVNDIFFDVKNNTNVKYLNFNFNKSAILESKNCIMRNNSINFIKKEINKICSIVKFDYNNYNNILKIKFNFEFNQILIFNNFYYKIKFSGKKKYFINKKNWKIKNLNFIQFKFLPKYFKKKFHITIYFNKEIINKCIFSNLSKRFLINSKNIIKDDSDIIKELNKVQPILDKNSSFSQQIDKLVPFVNNVENIILISNFLFSFFPKFISLLVRFTQTVYIWDFILLFNVNLGKYTNSFIENINFDYKLNIEFDEYFGISKINQYNYVIKLLTVNPKLLNFNFIYLTIWSIEFVILIFLIIWEILGLLVKIILNMIIKFYDKKLEKNKKMEKSLTTNNLFLLENIQKDGIILKNKLKIYNKIKIFLNSILIKIFLLKFTYIAINMVSLLSVLFIYSQFIYTYLYNNDNYKIFFILIFFYYCIFIYIKEILIVSYDHYFYNRQLYDYRNTLFYFNKTEYGIHNYILLITTIRDILIIFFNLNTFVSSLGKITVSIIIQIFYIIILFLINKDYDYKNIQLFKIQEVINFLLILDSFILNYTKFELFQFIFIILYFFLIIISLLNYFSEILYDIYKMIKRHNLFESIKIYLKKKFNKNIISIKINNNNNNNDNISIIDNSNKTINFKNKKIIKNKAISIKLKRKKNNNELIKKFN